LVDRHARQIKIRPPLRFAGRRGRLGGGTGVKLPIAVFVPLEPEIVYGLFAVALNELDDLDDGFRVGLSVIRGRAEGSR
jgi:hypothetical protein